MELRTRFTVAGSQQRLRFLMLVEILHTVRISIRSHFLATEPFLSAHSRRFNARRNDIDRVRDGLRVAKEGCPCDP
jgi:hypothetical protein